MFDTFHPSSCILKNFQTHTVLLPNHRFLSQYQTGAQVLHHLGLNTRWYDEDPLDHVLFNAVVQFIIHFSFIMVVKQTS